jgi:hypothetical protein
MDAHTHIHTDAQTHTPTHTRARTLRVAVNRKRQGGHIRTIKYMNKRGGLEGLPENSHEHTFVRPNIVDDYERYLASVGASWCVRAAVRAENDPAAQGTTHRNKSPSE